MSFLKGPAPAADKIKAQAPSVFLVCFRSKNANVVVYEANLQEDGTLHPDQPVVGYWLLLEESYRNARSETHDREEFSYIDEKFAWGFHARRTSPHKAEFSFNQYPSLRMSVQVQSSTQTARVFMEWKGRKYLLQSLYISASERWRLRPADNFQFMHLKTVDITERPYKPRKLVFHEIPA